jgi:cysteine-rich repeat protein
MRIRGLLLIGSLCGCNAVFGLDPVRTEDNRADAAIAIDAAAVDAAAVDAAAVDGATVDAPLFSDAPLPLCGNGVADPGEDCDDGQSSDLDGCTNLCQFNYAVVGCADGLRDHLTSITATRKIAGCAGSWSIPGLHTLPSGTTTCAHSGNNGPNPLGVPCAASDLCAAGWHLCGTLMQITADLEAGVMCDSSNGAAGFFSSNVPVGAVCDTASNTGLVGCGTVGSTPPASCNPLTRKIETGCPTMPGWSCTTMTDRTSVVKTGGDGGVLCCID